MPVIHDKRPPLETVLIMIVGIFAISAVVGTTFLFMSYIKEQGGLLSAILSFDARAFFTAADMMASGQGGSVYDQQAQFSAQQLRFPALGHFESLLIFAYPPFVAVALSPLALLESETAYLALLLVNLIALLLCTMLVREILRSHDYPIQLIAVLGLWSFFPLSVTLVQGQFSVFLLSGLLGCWVFLERGRGVVAGVFLSLLAVKPYLLLLPLVALISMGQVRALFGVLIGGVALFFVGLMVDGVSGWISWFELGEYIMQLEKPHFGVNPEDMFTLRSLLMALLGTDNSLIVHGVWIFSVALVSVAVFVVFHGHRKWIPNSTPLAWGGMITAMVLISPHAYMHDILLLYLPCLAMGRYVVWDGVGLESKVVIVCMVTWVAPLFFPVMIASNQTPIPMVLVMIFVITSISLIYRRDLVANSISIPKRND